MNDILTGIPVAEGVIPESVENFSEAAQYVIESMNDDFEAVFEDYDLLDEDGRIALDESFDDFDDEFVTEGVGELKDRVVDTLQSAWSAVKKWFEKVIHWFKEKARKAKEFLDDQVRKVSDKIDDMKMAKALKKFDDVTIDLVNKGKKQNVGTMHRYNIEGVIKRLDGSKYIDYIVGNVKKFAVAYDDIDGKDWKADKLKKSEVEGKKINDIKEINRIQFKGYAKAIAGREVEGASSMKVALMKDCVVADSEVTLKAQDINSNILTKLKNVVIYNETQKDIKESYNQARKMFKTAIAGAKAVLKRTTSKKAKKFAAANVSHLKSLCQLQHAAHATLMDACKRRYNEYLHILSNCARIAKKYNRKKGKDKEEKNSRKEALQNESFDSLFDF